MMCNAYNKHDHENERKSDVMSSGIMKEIRDFELLTLWDRMLKIQTRILAPGELAWMKSRWAFLGDILEIGSGNGSYGEFLAENIPNCYFWGVEANKEIARIYSDKKNVNNKVNNYEINICKFGEEKLPKKTPGKYTGCIARFVLQHSSSPERILKGIFNEIETGGRLFIIEEDMRLFIANTRWIPYDMAVNLWQRVCKDGGTNTQLGMNLPSLLSKIGFSLDDYKIELRNNVEMGDDFIELFLYCTEMLCKTAPELVENNEFMEIKKEFEKSRKTHKKMFVATYPQILVSATKN